MLGCREPLPGIHEQYVAARWRQVLGSTMHCVAGDGVGILAGAVIGAAVALPILSDLGARICPRLRLRLGDFPGFFHAPNGRRLLRCVVALNLHVGAPVDELPDGRNDRGIDLAWKGVAEAHDPLNPLFWFRMSIALMTGFVVAYPMNWWLVANHLKHGMMTVRRADGDGGTDPMPGMDMSHGSASADGRRHLTPPLAVMTLISIGVLAAGLLISWIFGGLSGQ